MANMHRREENESETCTNGPHFISGKKAKLDKTKKKFQIFYHRQRKEMETQSRAQPQEPGGRSLSYGPRGSLPAKRLPPFPSPPHALAPLSRIKPQPSDPTTDGWLPLTVAPLEALARQSRLIPDRWARRFRNRRRNRGE